MVQIETMTRYTVAILYLGSLYVVVPSFLFAFPITSGWISSITNITSLYLGGSVVFCGVVFLVDMGWSAVTLAGGAKGALANFRYGAILFGAGGVATIIVGILLFLNVLTLTNNSLSIGIWVALGIGIGSILWHSRAIFVRKHPIGATLANA